MGSMRLGPEVRPGPKLLPVRTRRPGTVVSGARIGVAVSGAGSNLRALRRAEEQGALGGRIVLVIADRQCPAVAWASERGIHTAVVAAEDVADRADWDVALSRVLREANLDLLVLAGFMRVVGPRVLDTLRGRILNVHPSLLPAFPGAHAVRDALRAGARVTGVTVHLVDESLDGGPIVAQEPVTIQAGDDEATVLERLHAVEHRLLPRVVSLAASGALTIGEDGLLRIDGALATGLPRPRRALLSVSDKRGLVDFARGLAGSGWELVSTGGTARTLREAGLEVTDVAAVTGAPEMLGGRVKTLHPRIAGGVLADLRNEDHRRQLAAQAIDPFELVVVNLYPFEEVAAREGVTDDELIEEIDIGGPTLVRAAAKNHASVAIVTDPDDYPHVLAELRTGQLGAERRASLAVKAFQRTAAYDAHIASVLGQRSGGAGGQQMLNLERVEELRYGENPHQRATLYRIAGAPPDAGPFAQGVRLLQGKPLSYNNILDAAAAAGLARDLLGPACVIVKHTNPCGAAESGTLAGAWEAALAGDSVSAFGGVVAITGVVDAEMAERLTSMFLEVVIAPSVDDAARPTLERKPNLRVLLDPALGSPPAGAMEYRSAGGGFLAQESDVSHDEPDSWRLVTTCAPSATEREDLWFAWRVARHVKSNAIVLAREGALVGVGAGQMSRVDSARLAVAKAGDRASGAACASDAFYPFADAVEVCLEAGVRAFVQPGGSQRDAEVIAAADAARASMLFTGVRHFRH